MNDVLCNRISYQKLGSLYHFHQGHIILITNISFIQDSWDGLVYSSSCIYKQVCLCFWIEIL